MAAALVHRRSRMLGLHLNDGYGKRDDGLMVGAVHTVQTIELLRQLRRDGFDGRHLLRHLPRRAGLDPVAECAVNIATVEAMFDVIDRLPDSRAGRGARTPQDAVAAQPLVQAAMLRLGTADASAIMAEPTQRVAVGSLHYDIMVRAPVPAADRARRSIGERLVVEAGRQGWQPGRGRGSPRRGGRQMIGCLGRRRVRRATARASWRRPGSTWRTSGPVAPGRA